MAWVPWGILAEGNWRGTSRLNQSPVLPQPTAQAWSTCTALVIQMERCPGLQTVQNQGGAGDDTLGRASAPELISC